MSIQRAPTNSGDAQTDTVLATLAPFRVLVLRGAAPAPGVPVSWRAFPDTGSPGALATTDRAGIAEFRKTLGSRAGTYGAVASVADAIGSPVTFTATANPGNPTLVRYVAGNNQIDTANARLRADYIVQVTDNHDNWVAGVAIDWAVTAGGGSITPARDTTAALNGYAVARHTLGPDEGAQTVTARASGLPGAPQQTFTATAFRLGSLQVTTATSGVDLDPNGFTVLVDEVCDPYYGYCNYAWSGSVGVNGVVTATGLRTGEHTVRLGDVAENCTVAGANPRTVTMQGSGVTPVSFAITCVALGSIQVTAVTTGVELDADGYAIIARRLGFGQSMSVPTNGTATMSGLPPGDYEVTLAAVAENCTVTGPNPRTVTVEPGGVAAVSFAITCVGRGSLQVTAATTGVDLDPDGYVVTAQRPGVGKGTSVPTNGTSTISGVPAGDYSVKLDGASANCDVVGPNPRTVSVSAGATAAVTFDVACAQASQLAVTVSGNINLVKSNGAGLSPLTATGVDQKPAWSPDGTRIAFVSRRAGSWRIYVMNADGTNPVRLTTDPAVDTDTDPAWSPAGTRIAFTRWRDGYADIYVMNADGTSQVRLTTDPATHDLDPAWSPDGTKLAFGSTRDGGGIFVMNADGSGVTRLTTNGAQPHWSPDGTKLVFSRFTGCDYYASFCDYDLFVMNTDGSGATQLTSGSSDNDPAWSPDGRWIAFLASFCDSYGYYGECLSGHSDVWLVRADGTRLVQLLTNASSPAWRP